MAATKSATKGTAKGKFVCDEYSTEFNGVEQQLHNPNVVFGTSDQLEGYDLTTTDDLSE